MGSQIKHIVVTGGFGFLGRSLVSKLIEKNYLITIIEKQETVNPFTMLKNTKVFYSDNLDFSKLFEIKTDLIIHTATLYGRNNETMHNIFETNLKFPLNLLEAAIEYNVPYFINTDTILNKHTNYYSLSKKQFGEWLQMLSENISIINLSLEHFYGPGASESNFITLMIKKLLSHEASIDLTEGLQKRNFIFISDIIDAYLLTIDCINNGIIKGPINNYAVSSNEIISIKELTLKLKKITNSQVKLNFGAIPYRKNEIMEPVPANNALQQLEWNPSVSLDEGLKKTVKSIVNNKK